MNKLTDEQVVKVLECHIKLQCWNDCPNATEERQLLSRPCSQMIAEDALDLIKRKDAKIEKLTEENIILSQKRANIFEILDSYERGRVEAYKEIVKKLKEHLCSYDLPDYHSFKAVDEDTIDEVLKELVGEQDD